MHCADLFCPLNKKLCSESRIDGMPDIYLFFYFLFFFFFFFLGGGGGGVNSRCWVKAYVSRKMKVPSPHPGEITTFLYKLQLSDVTNKFYLVHMDGMREKNNRSMVFNVYP